MDLTVRHRVAELMDQPGLDQQLHQQALSGLRRVNWFSRSSAILWPAIRDLTKYITRRPLRIVDVACGGGDIVVSVARLAARAGIDVEIAGCDISPYAVGHAQRRALTAGVDASFFELDALADRFPDDYDVVMCSLFLHHLEESAAAEFLRKMSAATRHLILVNDLRRTRTGYILAWLGCRLLSRSRIVHTDGPLSVAAAFSIDEAFELANQAGISNAVITRHWPQRFLLTWKHT
jgi:2-polyprenyl-3-methyl-5-hydroxy-6-metoxy-1,4-benzoquinol methylase